MSCDPDYYIVRRTLRVFGFSIRTLQVWVTFQIAILRSLDTLHVPAWRSSKPHARSPSLVRDKPFEDVRGTIENEKFGTMQFLKARSGSLNWYLNQKIDISDIPEQVFALPQTKRPSRNALQYRALLVAIVSEKNSFVLVFIGYRTIIARDVAKWRIAQKCLCKNKCQGGIAPFWWSAPPWKSITRYGVSQR